jgi:hypothetical protein
MGQDDEDVLGRVPGVRECHVSGVKLQVSADQDPRAG